MRKGKFLRGEKLNLRRGSKDRVVTYICALGKYMATIVNEEGKLESVFKVELLRGLNYGYRDTRENSAIVANGGNQSGK